MKDIPANQRNLSAFYNDAFAQQLVAAVSTVPSDAVFDAKDNLGNQMQSPSVIDCTALADEIGYRYLCAYAYQFSPSQPTRKPPFWMTALAGSNNLRGWNQIRPLLYYADMPRLTTVTTASGNVLVLLITEQWNHFGDDHQDGSHIQLSLFGSVQSLVSGKDGYGYACSSTGDQEYVGTPSFYSVTAQANAEAVDVVFGFHFLDFGKGRDQNGWGMVQGLSTQSQGVVPQMTYGMDAYNESLSMIGCSGNIGQRDSLNCAGLGRSDVVISLQEGNIQGSNGASDTLWRAWKVWMYVWEQSEVSGGRPTGLGYAVEAQIRTPKLSRAFGNPSVCLVSDPNDKDKLALVVSYFLFSEAAAGGEAGTLLFCVPMEGAPGREKDEGWVLV